MGGTMKRLLVSILPVLMLLFVNSALFAGDTVLTTMKDEINRNMQTLTKQDVPPYYMSYRVDDMTETYIAAAFGALESSSNSRNRYLTVDLRVGSPELDNSHELRDDYNSWFSRNDATELSLDDSALALKQTLWLQTDKYYKIAADQFAKVKANTAVKVKEEDKSPDFSAVTAEAYYEAPLSASKTQVDMSAWSEKLKRFSAVFSNNKDIVSSYVVFRFTVQRKYFVSSEGTSVAHNITQTRISVNAVTQADDGMKLPMYISYFAFTPSELPGEEQIMKDIRALSEKLSRLKKAPLVNSYTGPAILSADSAGVFFHEIFGHRVEGSRMKSENDSQTFKKKIGESVLPADMSVIFDPTMKSYNGHDLNGHYVFDDQGVRSKRVVVVNNGILSDFLMARKPIEKFPRSNGHGRAYPGYQPVSRQSNLIVETTQPLTTEELRKKLVDELKKQGKEYGFLFAQVTGGFTMTGRYVPNAFNVTPTEVYRVYADGRPDELVRGVDLVGTPLAMFSQIDGAGNDPVIFTGTCGAESGGVPVTAISPSLFVKQIEIQKKMKSQDKPPLLPRPDTEQQMNNGSEGDNL